MTATVSGLPWHENKNNQVFLPNLCIRVTLCSRALLTKMRCIHILYCNPLPVTHTGNRDAARNILEYATKLFKDEEEVTRLNDHSC